MDNVAAINGTLQYREPPLFALYRHGRWERQRSASLPRWRPAVQLSQNSTTTVIPTLS